MTKSSVYVLYCAIPALRVFLGNRLVGKLPEEFTRLRHLVAIDLSENSLSVTKIARAWSCY